jgi:hypothetical protein
MNDYRIIDFRYLGNGDVEIVEMDVFSGEDIKVRV